MSSDKVWHSTHQLGSWLFKIYAVLVLVGAFIPKLAIYVVLIPMILLVLILLFYSYFEFRKLHPRRKI
jgi:uncharacterized membrane protein